MAASIELYFFYNKKTINRFKFSFQSIPQIISKDCETITIPDSEFKYRKDKAQMKIQLYKYNSDNVIEFNFNIYNGLNFGYVNLDELYYHSFEIIFKNIENLQIFGNKIKFIKLDNMKNIDRKRLLLINYDLTQLKINGVNLNLMNVIQINCPIISSSYQLSEIYFNENKYIVKPFEKEKEYNFETLIKNKDKYENFSTELDSLSYIIDEDTFKNDFNKLMKKYKDLPQYDYIYFQKTTEHLNKIFDDNKIDYFTLFLNYFKFLYVFGNKDDYQNNRTVCICYLREIENIFEDMKDNNNISMNEKIRALNALFFTNGKLENIDDLKKLNIKYYYSSKISNNSILDKVYKFLNNYIEEINEESIVYETLLYLNGGYGFYNQEKVYTYDLTNLDMVKEHLRGILPQILIFCYMENDEIALTTPEFNGIVINEYHLLKKYNEQIGSLKIDYNKPIYFIKEITEYQANDIAMDITLYLIHEMMGHKKNSLTEPGSKTPKKIIKNKELIELKYFKESNPDNIDDKCEYILTSNNSKGDSGHYLELSYGKFDNSLIIKLLSDMDNKGKLIDEPRLFTDNGEILKEYVRLRKIIEKRNIQFNYQNIMSITDEIKEMKSFVLKKSFCNSKDIFKENDDKKIEHELLNRKRNNDLKFESLGKNIEKRDKLNLLKTNDNLYTKKELKKDENNNDDLPFNERIKNKSRDEIREMCRERVIKRFKFKFDEEFVHNMIKKLKELEFEDPYFQDLVFLIEDSRRCF